MFCNFIGKKKAIDICSDLIKRSETINVFPVVFTKFYLNKKKQIVFVTIYTRETSDNRGDLIVHLCSEDNFKEFELIASRKTDKKDIFIEDIRVFYNMNSGYGSILIDALKTYANENNFLAISGGLSTEDDDHIDRLQHFYQKNGFTVDVKKRNIKIRL